MMCDCSKTEKELRAEIERLQKLIEELKRGGHVRTCAHIRSAVFFDRDGTVIEAIHRPGFAEGRKEITAPFHTSEVRFMPGVARAFKLLSDAGLPKIMITNQPDVAHGYVAEKMWRMVHQKVVNYLEFDAVYMCRHRSQDHCPRKKPLPGMLFNAADDMGIDLSRSYMVGDTKSDLLAGKAAGCKVVLLDKPYNKDIEADFRVPDITTAVRTILGDIPV